MSYEGELLNACGVIDLDFSRTYVVAVSGSGPNVRYLKEAGKTELRRLRVDLPKPNDAFLYLERLMSERWNWAVLPNNCVAFAEEIIKEGGGTWASGSNCPTVATAATLSHRIQEFLARLEGEIYGLYGVPRF